MVTVSPTLVGRFGSVDLVVSGHKQLWHPLAVNKVPLCLKEYS